MHDAMKPHVSHPIADRFQLDRFLDAQKNVYNLALQELRDGEKSSHWMWFIFPQIHGLGSSGTAIRYAIRSIEVARAYLAHPILGPRLLACCQALMGVDGKSATDVMGYPDDVKLRSSMTLFALAAANPDLFLQVLSKYFDGHPDPATCEILGPDGKWPVAGDPDPPEPHVTENP